MKKSRIFSFITWAIWAIILCLCFLGLTGDNESVGVPIYVLFFLLLACRFLELYFQEMEK